VSARPPRPPDYTRGDVVAALRAVGVRAGDVLFTHASVGMLGTPDVPFDKVAIADLFASAFEEVLGPEGTWILPAYSYSYTAGETFDPASTPPGNMGLLTEVLWRRPGVVRSLDPIFSVIAFGARAQELAGDAGAEDCFGPDSVYARLLAADGAVANVGIGVHGALIHHIEQQLGVPYRYIKRFAGTTVLDGQARQTEVAYNVRDLDSERNVPYFMRLDHDARADGSAAVARVGRGEVNLLRARRMREHIEQGLSRDPEYLVLGDLAGRPVG
jgi:aminoglycoside 3-N-acetyltransferase